MGLTIHYSFKRERSPEELLKRAEIIAKKLGWEILERSWNKLIVHPHTECESVDLHFHKVKNIKPVYKDGKITEDWSFEGAKLKDFNFDDEEWFCGAFVKTHYAGYKVHVQVAEFLRWFGSFCENSEVHDESGYYETGHSEAEENRLKNYLDEYNGMMGRNAKKIKDIFGSDNVLCGGDL